MRELDAYWQKDLQAETDYLESVKCSHYKLSLREIKYFHKGITDYYAEANNFNYDFVDKLIELLKKWSVNHIQAMEKKVATCLSKKEK